MKIGRFDIPNAVLLAPMENVTDKSFRCVCKKLGADIVYTEFVNSEGLIRNVKKTVTKMAFLPEERPIGIQLYGGAPGSMERAAWMAEELQPDLLDINCGCWVKNVVGQGAGSSLLRDLPRMQELVSTVVKAVRLPVTVKTRLGWDDQSIHILEVAQRMQDAGAQALTIHCRTRVQGHSGPADYSAIPAVKQAVSIPIIVNGGIDSPEVAKAVFDSTGCDGVMVARGAIDNPWIFHSIKHYVTTGTLPHPPTLKERVEVLTEHLKLSVHYKGERRGVLEFRKHYSGYLRSRPYISSLRAELMQYTELEPVLHRLEKFLESEAAHTLAA
jgi:tRNA-dihydrouridine synthase B